MTLRFFWHLFASKLTHNVMSTVLRTSDFICTTLIGNDRHFDHFLYKMKYFLYFSKSSKIDSSFKFLSHAFCRAQFYIIRLDTKNCIKTCTNQIKIFVSHELCHPVLALKALYSQFTSLRHTASRHDSIKNLRKFKIWFIFSFFFLQIDIFVSHALCHPVFHSHMI